MKHNELYDVQIWGGQDNETLITTINDLSLDGAREIARCHRDQMAQTGRIICQTANYCEVYAPGKPELRGTHAQTTRVFVYGN